VAVDELVERFAADRAERTDGGAGRDAVIGEQEAAGRPGAAHSLGDAGLHIDDDGQASLT
jgi:hypothetical protein